ncbi:MAG: glycerophosphodiester phosphodiesterase [Candidatus Helarchaeota archaeon]
MVKIEKFKIIAHRGASGYVLENSYSAFEKAIKLKADMIETDVRSTKDGHLVLMHDNKINRTTLGTGRISKMTIEQIQQVKMKNNEPIPVLDTVLEKYGKKIQFNLEIKSKNIEEKINELIIKYDLIERIMISSFYYNILQKFHQINPKLFLAFLIFLPYNVVSLKFPFRKLKNDGVRAINPYYKFVSKSFVENAHNNGLKIYPWTINKKDQVLYFKNNIKVDGIITDYPDILL